MDAKHTPGPWVYAEDEGAPGDPSTRPRITTVAWCCDFVIGLPSDIPGGNYRDGDPSGDPEADAKLIAAAPDLLAALQLLEDDYAAMLKGNGISEPNTRLLAARAAIAKATS